MNVKKMLVNIPNTPADNIEGIRIIRQGMRVYHSALNERKDPRGRSYYWIGGSIPSGIPDDGTDFGAISEGYVITPSSHDHWLEAHPFRWWLYP